MTLPESPKGLPLSTGPGISLATGKVPLPALVLRQTELEHNLRWMQRFMEERGLSFAPHGKTTMLPDLFRRQLEHGAWGITVATAAQARTAYDTGVRRIMLANQLVDGGSIRRVAELLADPELELLCFVDSTANVEILTETLATFGVELPVLVDLGLRGGRSGCRSIESAVALAQRVAHSPALVLAGVGGYEGVLGGKETAAGVGSWLDDLVKLAVEIDSRGLFDRPRPVITASGSAWYDIVAGRLGSTSVRERFLPVLRPGCYVVHDHGLYGRAQEQIGERSPDVAAALKPAMEVWACVQSRPEPGLAIVGMGKRDVSSDPDMPIVLRHYRNGQPLELAKGCCRVTRLMDQHAFIELTPETDVQVGDIMSFGSSHPCLTFQLWRHVCLADEELAVRQVWETRF